MTNQNVNQSDYAIYRDDMAYIQDSSQKGKYIFDRKLFVFILKLQGDGKII